MKYLAICVLFLAISAYNAQKHKRCRAQQCANVEGIRQHLINFRYECLDLDSVKEWKKCVCSDMQEVNCPGDKFNKCTNLLRVNGNDECKGALDRRHELNFNCFCTRFLGFFSNKFCSNELDQNPAEQIHKYWEDAYENLPAI